MEIPSDHPVLVGVIESGCPQCNFMVDMARGIVDENSASGLVWMPIDARSRPVYALELQPQDHPTLALFVNGRERARLTGTGSRRQALRRFLPYLYREPEEVLEQLRDQLGSPGETLPSRRRERLCPRRSQKADLLRTVPLFEGLTKSQLYEVARYADEVTIEAERHVLDEGAPGDEFWILLSGKAEVRRRGRVLRKMKAGDFFGEMALLDGDPRSASVVSSCRCETLVLHRRDFDFVLEETPDVARRLLATLSRRLREAGREVVN